MDFLDCGFCSFWVALRYSLDISEFYMFVRCFSVVFLMSVHPSDSDSESNLRQSRGRSIKISDK